MTEYIEFEVFGFILRYYDEERIDKNMRGKWRTIKQSTDCGYKTIALGNKRAGVHRVVYKAHNLSWNMEDTSKNNYIDHIDRSPTNNKIDNLRVATNQQNLFNTNAKGYSFKKQSNKYQARIRVNGKDIYLGNYTEEADAREAYLNAKLIYHKLV